MFTTKFKVLVGAIIVAGSIGILAANQAIQTQQIQNLQLVEQSRLVVSITPTASPSATPTASPSATPKILYRTVTIAPIK